MSLNKKFRACTIIFILLISSLTIFIIAPNSVNAQETEGETTLYFTPYSLDAFGLGLEEYDETTDGTEELINYMSISPPTKSNDSYYPPRLSETEEWATWALLWAYTKIGLEEMGDLGSLAEIDELNPFLLKENYDFNLQKDAHIKGNIRYDLYFESPLLSKLSYKDELNVSVYIDNIKIKSTNVILEPELFKGKIQKQTIYIEDVDFFIQKGNIIKFSVELVPGDKPIGNLIARGDLDDFMDRIDNMADILLGLESFPTMVEIGTAIKEIVNATQTGEVNLSVDDISDLINSLRACAFVYGSANHPSSVTIPNFLVEDENKRTYYLGSNNELTVKKSTNQEGEKAELEEAKVWTGPALERNKILKEATASLYFEHRNLVRLLNPGDTKLIASLYYDEEVIATSEKELGKNTILDSLIKPIEPTVFEFEIKDDLEIENGQKVKLKIGVAEDTKFGPLGLGLYRDVKLIYDSDTYSSSLTIIYEETDNIKINVENEPNKKIITGGSAVFEVSIESIHTDTVTIDPIILNEKGKWDEIDYPETVTVRPDEVKVIKIFVNHSEETLDAYETSEDPADYIELMIKASGLTGLDTKDVDVTVSQDAVEYDIDVVTPSDQEVKHGKTGKYIFTVINNNTGLWPDNYEIDVKSEHKWNISLEYKESDLEEVGFNKSFDVTVEVKVPKNTEIESDKLTFIVTSKEGKITLTVNVTTKVINPNIFESIYQLFEKAAKKMGLDDVLGDYAAPFLMFLLGFIIFIFLVLLIAIFRKKYAELICLERIKDISPDEKADYTIEIKNPNKIKRNYEIKAKMKIPSDRWEVELNTDEVSLDSKQSKPIQLTVKPTDLVKEEDWLEVIVIAKLKDRKKQIEISTVTTIKEAKPKLKISRVLNWPTTFKKGERVETSFRVENRGKVAANKVSIVLYLNGEEKNKVEDITIPRGGYAEVEMPWIAVKGKNDIEIVVK